MAQNVGGVAADDIAEVVLSRVALQDAEAVANGEVEWLRREGITGPSADACLAAAEVQP